MGEEAPADVPGSRLLPGYRASHIVKAAPLQAMGGKAPADVLLEARLEEYPLG